MCRNIRNLYNFKPPATDEEIHASSLQFVRKLSGFNRPSKANEEAFNRAVDAVTQAARELIDSLITTPGLNARGVAVLLVEQNVAAALEIAHRAYVLEEGRIVAEGAPRELASQPHIRRAYLGLN